MPDADVQVLLHDLRAAGLRRTPARVAVLAAVRRADGPLTHAQILATSEASGLDAITLYRTLAALEQARLLHRVHGVDGAWRACAQPEGRNGCPGNHIHFQCTSCRAMSCLVDQPMPRVLAPPGARVEGRNFVAFGRCAACFEAEGHRAAGERGEAV